MILHRDKGWSIFKIDRSRHLQLRVTIGGKTTIKSSGAGDMETAKAFARRFRRNLHPRDQKPPALTLEEAAQDVIRNNKISGVIPLSSTKSPKHPGNAKKSPALGWAFLSIADLWPI